MEGSQKISGIPWTTAWTWGNLDDGAVSQRWYSGRSVLVLGARILEEGNVQSNPFIGESSLQVRGNLSENPDSASMTTQRSAEKVNFPTCNYSSISGAVRGRKNARDVLGLTDGRKNSLILFSVNNPQISFLSESCYNCTVCHQDGFIDGPRGSLWL